MAEDEGNAGGSETLNQDDIDSLMQQASEDSVGKVYKPTGGFFDKEDNVNVRVLDFRNPVYLSEIELRQLNLKHQQFTHFLSAKLSMFLRMDFKLKLEKMTTITYQAFLNELASPAAISLFSLSSLKGVGITSLGSKLAMTLVNRMLGGKGHSVGEERPLTEIEFVLAGEVFNLIVTEWCHLFKDVRHFEPTLIGTETDAQFLQTASHDTVMLVVEMDAELGDCSEKIHVAFPNYMIDPIIKKIQDDLNKYSTVGASVKKARWVDTFDDIKVPVFAEWEVQDKMSLQDILYLKEGDILEFPKAMMNQTQVRLMKTPCYQGKLGINQGKVAIELSDKIINKRT